LFSVIVLGKVGLFVLGGNLIELGAGLIIEGVNWLFAGHVFL
jgi:hypothetical protein